MKINHAHYLSLVVSASILLALNGDVYAQKKKKKDNKDEKATTAEKPKTSSISDKVKSCRKNEGLFTMYQDTVNGSTYMLVKKDQIGKEFIYFSYTENGVVEAGHFRGSFRDNKVFSVQRYYDKIEFVTENTGYYFDTTNRISRAAAANISPSILVSQKIVAEEKDKGEILIDANSIFLSESLSPVKPTPFPGLPPGAMFSLGSLSKDKTKFTAIKNYPRNTDVIVEYVFDNPSPINGGGKEITDARSVSIRLQHSFIEMPVNNYRPRFDDPRIGYFMDEIEDMTSVKATNYRDVIHRWNLEKKDKSAAVSEPVQPIVYWIENTTPLEFRETIRMAGLKWNEAFEAAGIKNAIEMKIQPDDADWDAGDIRYNVIRWTSSPQPPFGGYGPSFVNPRTGEILGADIMLEYIFVTNRLRQEKLFDAAALNMDMPQIKPAGGFCSLGNHLHQESQFGLCALNAAGMSPIEIKEYINSSLYYLVLHEMGHTLGLNHNMKASQLHSPEKVHDKPLTTKTGLTGSVMDYPSVNLSLDKSKQGQYFTTTPGPYDYWAIDYGYSQALENEAQERERLARIAEKSTQPELAFGNDADDMRSPGRGIDPRVMIGDMSSDAITYSSDRIRLANNITVKLKDKYSKTGESYHDMRVAYMILTGEVSTAAGVISRYIGGVYVDRGFVGQKNAGIPFKAVSYTDQKRAMQSLSENIFAADAFDAPAQVYQYLQMQRRGFNFFGANEDPRIHDRVLNIQKNVLNQLLHQNVLKRMTDSKMYGNEYAVSEMMSDLTNAIFKKDAAGNVNSFRQNLQVEYVNRLIAIAGLTDKTSYDNFAQAAALASLKNIQKTVGATVAAANGETSAHRQFIAFKIQKALTAK
jgi:hypothetical protein